MTAQTTRSQPWYRKIFAVITGFFRRLTEPAKTVEENQRTRARLLSGLSISLSLGIVLVSLFSQHMNARLWITMPVTFAVFIAGYFVSRTRYYRAAIPLVIVGPAVPAVVVAAMQIPGINILATLMWLALPLLISSLILNAWQSHLVALGYSILAVSLSLFKLLDYESLGLLIVFFFMITFFSVTSATIRGRSLGVIEKQLAEQQYIQKTLADSEVKYRKLFEVANDAIILTDYDSGIIIDANQTASALLGLPKETLQGTLHSRLFPPERAADIEGRFMSRTAENKNQAFYDDLVLQRPDGTQVQVNVANTFFELHGKQVTQSVYRDITERHILEKRLKESEEKFSKAFMASPALITITNLNERTFMEVNDSFTRTTGYTLEDLKDKTADNFNMWVSSEHRDRMVKAATKREIIVNEEMDFRYKSGKIGTSLVSTEFLEIGGKECLMVVSSDITESRRAREALNQSEEQLAKVLHLIPQQVFITRLSDGKIIDINEGVTRATGYTRKEAVGRTTKELNFWADYEDRTRMFRILEKEGRVYNQEYNFRMKSGEIRTELYSGEVITLNNEPCLITILTDITERKKIEKNLIASEEKFSKAFRYIPESIAITCISNQKFIDVNEVFCQSVNKSRDEIIGNSAKELGFPEPEGQYERLVKTIRQHGAISNQEQPILAPGRTGTLLYSADIAEIGGEECIIGIYHDITNIKATEKALRESEKKFSRAFHAIPESIAITRLKDQKFIDVNNVFCQAINKSPDEVIGHSAAELGLPDPEGRYERIINTILTHGPISNEEQQIMAAGQSGTLLFSADIIDIDGEPCMISIINDITKLKDMETDLRDSEEKFSKTFHAIPERLCISRVSDGVILDINAGFLTGTSRPREDTIGKNVYELGFWRNKDERVKIIEDIQNQGTIFNREIPHTRPSGETGTTLLSADIVNIKNEPYLLTISHDISERKRMEQALKNSEKRFAKAFNDNPDGITISNLSKHKFIEVNDSFLRMTGYTREEILDQSANELNLWANPVQHEKMELRLDKRLPIQSEEMELLTKSGQVLDTLFSSEFTEINGEPCVVAVNKDITERKKIEQAVKLSEEKFYKIFQTVPEHILISRVKDGMFVDANENFCKSVGRTREELIGHNATQTGLKGRPEHPEDLIKTIQEQGGIYNREVISDAHTENMKVNLFSARIVDIAGEPCMVSVSTDITERKKMEQALADEVTRRRVLIERSSDGIVILDQKGGVYEANKRFCEMLGYTAEEIKDLHVWDWEQINPRKEQILERLATIDEKGDHFETIHTRKDKSNFNVGISSSGVLFAGQKLTFCVCRDITERKRMEKVIRESEEKFSKAFHAIPEAISISRAKDGEFLEVNDSFAKSMNRSRESIIGRRGTDIGLPDPVGDFFMLVKRIRQHGGITNEETRVTLNNGDVRTMLLSAELLEINGEDCVLCVTNDITERKKMEQSLRESEEKFSKIFRLTPLQVIISRLRGNQLPVTIDVNDSFVEHSGYTREEVIGKTMRDLNMWKNASDSLRVQRMIQKESRYSNLDVDIITKTGEVRAGLISSESLEINGEPCLISIFTDITERKQAEADLKQAMLELKLSSAQLKATNKELESFSYSVSHDLRSPLRTIDGFSQALLEDYGPKLDETAQDYLNRMRNASQKMGELIDGLLKLSRLTRSEVRHENVDLSALAQDIATRLQETNPERKAEFIIHPGLKTTGDPQMLRVMMENLLNNAWKFTKKVPSARIEFGNTPGNGRQTFFIKDNGAGFDMAYVDKLFGAFQRLHNVSDFPGTGIGLATVQRIVNRHGGNIHAEGAVDKGATFYFSL